MSGQFGFSYAELSEHFKMKHDSDCSRSDWISKILEFWKDGSDTDVRNTPDKSKFSVKDDDALGVICQRMNEDSEYENNYFDQVLEEISKKCCLTEPKKLEAEVSNPGSDEIDQLIKRHLNINPNFLNDASIKVGNDDKDVNLDKLCDLDKWKVNKPIRITIETGDDKNSVVKRMKEEYFQKLCLRKIKLQYNGNDRGFKHFFDVHHYQKESLSQDDIPSFRRIEYKKIKGSGHISELKTDDERGFKVFGNLYIMKKLSDDLTFQDKHSLLKVSRLVRQTMKELKLDFDITDCFNSLRIGQISSTIVIKGDHSPNKPVQYIEKRNGCVVENHRGNSISISEDYRIRFLEDLMLNMKHQKTSLQNFTLTSYDYIIDYGKRLDKEIIETLMKSSSESMKMFDNFFESKKRVIRTVHLEIVASCQGDIRNVLKHMDSRFLRSIRIGYPEIETQRKLLELNEVCKMDQWKNAEAINISHFIISTPIQELDICKFSSGEITVNILTTSDVLYLKEGFLASQSLEKFKIQIVNCEIDDTVNLIVGWPFRVANPFLRNQRSVWFFLIPNTNKFLHIVYFVPHSVIFRHCDFEDVPEEFFVS